jgi:hypothetical protein
VIVATMLALLLLLLPLLLLGLGLLVWSAASCC